jgi:hypothetical protein
VSEFANQTNRSKHLACIVRSSFSIFKPRPEWNYGIVHVIAPLAVAAAVLSSSFFMEQYYLIWPAPAPTRDAVVNLAPLGRIAVLLRDLGAVSPYL